jgi:hypothetical protein
MESTLEIKDFLDFDKLYKDFKFDILEKHAESKPLSEDLARIFQNLFSTI